MTPSLGSFLYMIELSVENFSLYPISTCSDMDLSHSLVSCHQEKSALPLLLPLWGRCSQQWGHPSVSSLNWTNLTTSAVPRKSCLIVLSPSLFLSFGHILVFLYTSYTVRPKTGHRTWGEASQYKSHNYPTMQVLIVNWLTLKAPNIKIYF